MKITIKGNSIDITITTDENCTVEGVGNVIPKTGISPLLQEHRKGQAIQFLKDQGKDTSENIKLINDVVYTDNAIIIGGVSWSYNNAKASDFGLSYTIDDKDSLVDYNKPHVFKGEGKYSEEDYFNFSMVDKIVKEKQAKVPSYEDIWNSLVALPGDTKGKAPKEPTYVEWGIGVRILSILLGTEMSGYRDVGVWTVGSYGYLWSRSESGSDGAWACGWVETRGRLARYGREYARPLRLLA